MTIPIQNEDIVSRHVFLPLDFKEGILDLENTFHFNSSNHYLVSVYSHQLLQDLSKLHALGLKNADIKNARRKQEGKKADKAYKGYVSGEVLRIRKVKVEEISFDIVQHTEEGEKAHCNLTMKFPSKKPPSAQRSRAEEEVQETFRDFTAYMSHE